MAELKPGKPNPLDDVIYDVTFAGLCIIQNPHGPTGQGIEAPYKIKVKIDHKSLGEHGPLSAFKRFIAPDIMPKHYPGFMSLKTFRVEDAECEQPELVKKNIHLLNYESLKAFIADNDLPIDVELYKDAGELRAAITEQAEDPNGFKATQEWTAKKHGKSIESRSRLLQLNQGVKQDTPLIDATGNEPTEKETAAKANGKKSAKDL